MLCRTHLTLLELEVKTTMCSWFWYGNFGTNVFWGSKHKKKKKKKWVDMTHQSNIHASVTAAVFEGTGVEIA